MLSSHLAEQESFGENHKRTSYLIPAEKSARCCATKASQQKFAANCNEIENN